MPPIPKPNGLYLQLPPHHRSPITNNDSPLAGLPYTTIAAYNKSISIWKLIQGLEISVQLYCHDCAAVDDVAAGMVEMDDGDDVVVVEEEANDEEEDTPSDAILSCKYLSKSSKKDR
jgi:hypothetical protein